SLLKRPNCRFWYAQYYDASGHQVRVSTKTEVKQIALGVLKKLMAERDNNLVPVSEMRKLHYADLRQILLDNYIARGNKSLRVRANGEETVVGLKQLDEFFGYRGNGTVIDPGWSVTQITTDAAKEFVRQRRAEGVGNAVINRSLAALRRMLSLAKKER